MKIRAIMLTGDNRRTAEAVANGLGVEVRAELLPQDKQRIVKELQSEGLVVAKVGDGINDAPALAAADIGIAMGGGADVALETADAAVLHGRVQDVPDMIDLSRGGDGQHPPEHHHRPGLESGLPGHDGDRRHRPMAGDPRRHRGDRAGDGKRHAPFALEAEMSRDVLTTSSSGCESGAGVRSPIGGVFVKLATMAALSGAETLAGTRHV
jgi:hypothetical protein